MGRIIVKLVKFSIFELSIIILAPQVMNIVNNIGVTYLLVTKTLSFQLSQITELDLKLSVKSLTQSRNLREKDKLRTFSIFDQDMPDIPAPNSYRPQSQIIKMPYFHIGRRCETRLVHTPSPGKYKIRQPKTDFTTRIMDKPKLCVFDEIASRTIPMGPDTYKPRFVTTQSEQFRFPAANRFPKEPKTPEFISLRRELKQGPQYSLSLKPSSRVPFAMPELVVDSKSYVIKSSLRRNGAGTIMARIKEFKTKTTPDMCSYKPKNPTLKMRDGLLIRPRWPAGKTL